MATFTRKHRIALTLTTATLSLALATAAHAQAAPETNVEKDSRAAGNQQSTDAPPASPAVAQDEASANEVVVTGFRESLNSALNIKRNETATVDAIKAEDIAEFPDLNLAESLQRIPGVAISRCERRRGVTSRSAGWGRNIPASASTGWRRSAPPAAPTIRAA